MPEMRFARRNIVVYSGIFVACYISLVYLLLKCSVYAEVTSLVRRMLAKTVTHRVYGYGTIMVDVKNLGRKNTMENEVFMNYTPTNRFRTVKDRSFDQTFCFKLSMNGSSLTFQTKRREYSNKDQGLVKEMHSDMVRSKEKGYGSEPCNCYITINSPPGRSGNQMFQVAALLGAAYGHDLIPIIPSDFPLSEWFELPNVMDLNLTNPETFTVKKSGIYFPEMKYLSGKKNWTMHGYFQSWKYFRNAQYILKKAFKIKEKYLNNPESFIRNISKTGQENVCVHVRRGDLSDKVAFRKGYTIAGLEFIYNAMKFYRKKFKTVQFIILSDGITWCIENIKGRDVVFSPFYWPIEDMALMTLCDHVVVTSGTFGWWGAWLSGGTTVYYDGYPRPGSWLGSQIDRNDYYPPGWIAL